jgi:hypothetical protein
MTICSGIFGPTRFTHAGIADFGKSIQKLGLFHCVKELRGITAIA